MLLGSLDSSTRKLGEIRDAINLIGPAVPSPACAHAEYEGSRGEGPSGSNNVSLLFRPNLMNDATTINDINVKTRAEALAINILTLGKT